MDGTREGARTNGGDSPAAPDDTIERNLARLLRNFRHRAKPADGPRQDGPDGERGEQGEEALLTELLRERTPSTSSNALRGLTLGRYVVLGELGRGGMGTVLKAYDESLDRAVAIKLLREEVDDRHTERLRREARAMAQLSHPNVVQVYEVGRVEGRTFVAMELVDGQTPLEWIEQEPTPDWRARIGVFIQLGAGLVAAHRRGLVHRDFKPGNALIDGDGRARVLDFGLVSRVDEVGDDRRTARALAQTTSEDVPLDRSLTRTGVMLGTPAYMPPEQILGQEADARSDQFSFCVSLYQVLYGEHPVRAKTWPALRSSVLAGRLAPRPRGGAVPKAVHGVLTRGLSVDPDDRLPSMEALIGQLRAIVAPRRRIGLGGGVMLGALVLGAGLAGAKYLEVRDRCTGAAAQLSGVWDDSRRGEVADAILGTELSFSSETWERVEGQLDEYADTWTSKHTEICEATHQRGEQSTEVMDLRMECLRQRRTDLREAVDVLAQADSIRVEKAVNLTSALPRLSRCDDVESLRAGLPPPRDPAEAAEVELLRQRLAKARALGVAGAFEEARDESEAVVERAQDLGYGPLRAEALLHRGRGRLTLARTEEQTRSAVEDFEHAYRLAAELGHGSVEVQAANMLVNAVGDHQTKHELGLQWGTTALALARGRPSEPEVQVTVLNDIGYVLRSQGRFDEALAHHEDALELAEQRLGTEHRLVAEALDGGAAVMSERGNFEEALPRHRRALQLREAALGPNHPEVAPSLINIGIILKQQGEQADALAHFLRARSITEDALGAQHPSVAVALMNIASVRARQGELADARELYQQALGIFERAREPSHLQVVGALMNLGVLSFHEGRLEEALDAYQRALTVLEAELGPDDHRTGQVLINIGITLLELGRLEESQAANRRALVILVDQFGPDHIQLCPLLTTMGFVSADQGRPDEAVAHLQRALAIQEAAHGADHPTVAATLTNLGAVLTDHGRPEDALVHHRRALVIYEQAFDSNHPDRAVPHTNLGLALAQLGQHAEAIDHLQRAISIHEENPDHPGLATPLFGLAQIEFDRGALGAARDYAERTVSIREDGDVSPALLAEARFLLARALWPDGSQRWRAQELAEQAREGFMESGDGRREDRAEVESWLAQHRTR